MIHRGRRLRRNSVLRALVRENSISVEDFIYPIFVIEGINKKEPIPSMEGQFYYTVDRLNEEIKELVTLGINSVILFGLPDEKDELGSEAYADNGVIQRAIRKIKEEFEEILVVTDVCLCEYTSHGHCGVLEKEIVNNDKTLELLGKIALSHAKAGADIIAPSDMMDGRVGYIRSILDEQGFEDIAIMSYSVKFSSAFYGPFKEAAKSTPKSGDRKSYQMDFCNGREAIKEATWDVEEGADIIMVKPAMSYLDIVYSLKEKFNLPIAVYNVSGEYAMVKAAAKAGLIDEEKMIMETLYSMKRAGADIIITYFAKDAARIIRGE
jgi:porphobilinogen synthase